MDPAYGHPAAPLDPDAPWPAPPAGEGGTLDPAAQALLAFVTREARRMEFDQALLLLERALGADALRQGRLRVRPRPGPEFAVSDIERLTQDREGNVTAEVTFMGLYGPVPALPRYFTEPIAHEDDEAEGLRGFLDLFHARLYRLYHDAWRKYRPRVRFTADRDGEAQAAPDDVLPFIALAGVPERSGAWGIPLSPLRLAAMAGRLGTRARNAAGLRDLLGHFLEVPTKIEENHPRWVTAPRRGRLGAGGTGGIQLGYGALLGARIYDVSGKARVVFGPLDIEDFRSLLPGGARAELAAGLIRFYLPDGLDYDVELLLRSAQTHPLILGDGKSRLGRNAWVGTTGPGIVSEVVTYN